MQLQVRRLGLLGIILVVGAALGACAAPTSARAGDDAGLFGTREVYSADITPFDKWNKMEARYEQQRRAPQDLCPTAEGCVTARWDALVPELRQLPVSERVERVNQVLNQLPYVTSVANWQDPNHWETPYEFLARGGQCQDYAIAKFMALKESGMSEQQLRVVVVHDKQVGLDHAITVVYEAEGPVLLDNQIRSVTPVAAVARYAPYYSINDTGWWMHVKAVTASIHLAANNGGFQFARN